MRTLHPWWAEIFQNRKHKSATEIHISNIETKEVVPYCLFLISIENNECNKNKTRPNVSELIVRKFHNYCNMGISKYSLHLSDCIHIDVLYVTEFLLSNCIYLRSANNCFARFLICVKNGRNVMLTIKSWALHLNC